MFGDRTLREEWIIRVSFNLYENWHPIRRNQDTDTRYNKVTPWGHSETWKVPTVRWTSTGEDEKPWGTPSWQHPGLRFLTSRTWKGSCHCLRKPVCGARLWQSWQANKNWTGYFLQYDTCNERLSRTWPRLTVLFPKPTFLFFHKRWASIPWGLQSVFSVGPTIVLKREHIQPLFKASQSMLFFAGFDNCCLWRKKLAGGYFSLKPWTF